MIRIVTIIILTVSLFFHLGCGRQVISHVSVFHNMPHDWKAKTIKILPFENSLQSSLEFKTYQNLIGDELQKSSIIAFPNHDLI